MKTMKCSGKRSQSMLPDANHTQPCRLVHTGLGASSLVAHVLHYPTPPTRTTLTSLCNRYCRNKHTHQHRPQSLPREQLCVLHPRGHGSAETYSLHCTLSPAGLLHAQGAIRSGTRYAKWAGGSRSQTHRRAAMGGFTQDDDYVQGVAPMHCARPPRILLDLFTVHCLARRFLAKTRLFLITKSSR